MILALFIGFFMVGGIVFGICFLIYMAWIYMKSCVFMTRGFINDEKEINNVPMKQFFHFNFRETSYEKSSIN